MCLLALLCQQKENIFGAVRRDIEVLFDMEVNFYYFFFNLQMCGCYEDDRKCDKIDFIFHEYIATACHAMRSACLILIVNISIKFFFFSPVSFCNVKCEKS